jgi:hypothetical protein
MRGNGIGQATGFLDAGERCQDFRRDLLVQLDVLVELRHHRAAHRLDLVVAPLFGTHRRDVGDEHLVRSMRSTLARCAPSTSTFTVPSGNLSICSMLATQPTL